MDKDFKVEFDELDGFWFVAGANGNVARAPFESEQDAYDWIEAFGDEYRP